MLYVGAQRQKPGDCQREHYHGRIGVELDGDICCFRGKQEEDGRNEIPGGILAHKTPQSRAGAEL